MTDLTPEQRTAVNYKGNLLLTACPGSGKTRTLLGKLVSEIEGVRGSTRSICCITYTNTAVQEIEIRALEQIQPGDEHHYYVSTIHAFCLNEIFRRFAWLKPEYRGTVRVLTRDNPDFDSICSYAANRVNYNRELSTADYDAFEALSVDARGKIVGLAANNDMVGRAAIYFWERSAALGYIDFGQIIYNSYLLLRDHPRIASSLCAKYAWFLIDEFQDTTELQLEILKLLYATERSKFFVVGDLAQSIYGFTGARPELVEPFGVLIGARSDLSLSGNFRSSKKIVVHAERLFPRLPPMSAVGPDKDCPIDPTLIRANNAFEAITECFLPALAEHKIQLGEATILAKDWASLFSLTRGLRAYGTPVVGPGARPYKRSRLFATLAEQLCGAVVDPQPDSNRQLARALFHAVQDVTGFPRLEVFAYEGRLVIIRLLNKAKELAEHGGAIKWLDNMAEATGGILVKAELIDVRQSGLFYASVQEMKADMQKQGTDLANLSVDDLGLFASPNKALRLSTIHYAKGREYGAVAMIGLRHGTFPHFKATDIEAEKRLFYVGVTRARKLLMYVAEQDKWQNPPSPFLGRSGVQMF